MVKFAWLKLVSVLALYSRRSCGLAAVITRREEWNDGKSMLVFEEISDSVKCNGYEEYCDVSFGDLSWIGVHDSYAVENESTGLTTKISSDQYLGLHKQLSDGCRILTGQGHPKDEDPQTVEVCHTDCRLLDGGTLASYMLQIKNFLQLNPHEIVTLIWVNSIDPTIAIGSWAKVYTDLGLDKLSYVPPGPFSSSSDWPTLRQLIENNTRLISFMDSGADPERFPFILDEYTYLVETEPDPLDMELPCTVRRPRENAPLEGKLFLNNHNLNLFVTDKIKVPYKKLATETNALSGNMGLLSMQKKCLEQYGRFPNIVLVDFYDVPNYETLRWQAQVNGVKYYNQTEIHQIDKTNYY